MSAIGDCLCFSVPSVGCCSNPAQSLKSPPPPRLSLQQFSLWRFRSESPPNPAPGIAINRSKSGENPSVPARILHKRTLPLTIPRWFWSLTSAAITCFPKALAIMRIAACAHPGSLLAGPSSQPTASDQIASNLEVIPWGHGGVTVGCHWKAGHGAVISPAFPDGSGPNENCC
jgi:hypothetical protein